MRRELSRELECHLREWPRARERYKNRAMEQEKEKGEGKKRGERKKKSESNGRDAAS